MASTRTGTRSKSAAAWVAPLVGAHHVSRAIDPIIILIRVAENGFAQDIARLTWITKDPDLLSYLVKEPRGPRRRTLLHAAAYFGDLTRARYWCELGAPLNAVMYPKRQTPLHLCGGERNLTRLTWDDGYAATAALLLDRGADIGAVDSQSQTAMFCAVRAGNAAVVRLLFQRGAGEFDREVMRHFSTACYHGFPGVVEVLLKHGLDAKSVSWFWIIANFDNIQARNRPLATHDAWTLKNNHRCLLNEIQKLDGRATAITAVMLDHGFDVNSRDAGGRTVLSFAEGAQLVQLAALLRARGGVG